MSPDQRYDEERAGAQRYADSIRYLQRAELDDQGLVIPPWEIAAARETAFDVSAALPVWLRQVSSISRAPSQRSGESAYPTEDLLAGCHGQDMPVYFAIRGTPRAVRLYLGTDDQRDGEGMQALFESQFPGGELWPAAPTERNIDDHRSLAAQLQEMRTFLDQSEHIGVVTGLPTVKAADPAEAEAQIDRVIRGLYGANWLYLVLATPISDSALSAMRMALLGEQLRVEQEEELRGRRERGGQSIAAMYHELLGLQDQLLEACQYEGAWWTQTYLCGGDRPTYQRAKALVRSVFSGDNARIDRIRVLDAPGAGRKAASFSPIQQLRSSGPGPFSIAGWQPHRYETMVPSAQLSALVHLPRREVPGFFIRDMASFDVTSHLPARLPGVVVGEILNLGRPTQTAYRVHLDDLTKHALVVGITGSGKTQTIFRLLTELQQQTPPVPFLAVEPAKREYRRLAGILPPNRPLHVFTVGEEHAGSAPFRLNPFEIRRGVSVSTHINLLKSVFNATFGMWSPLPQVLERAIHEIYQDKGWNAVANDNVRAGLDHDGWHPRAHPTLSDLHHKIDMLVPQLGYEPEIAANIRTALLTRLDSLRVGAKGRMLDTATSIPIETLFHDCTVLELEGIGDDDDKAFVMGLILISIYEAYQAGTLQRSGSLGHLTVIEEAHRLLANVSTARDPEAGDPRGKAVDTFVNMLSEIRAYGEGFVIAEQIPTKLAPEVIKNTALKIVLRLVAGDDRAAVGASMNLDQAQLGQLVTLAPLEAVVHGGGPYGDDRAILIRVWPVQGRALPAVDIRAQWEEFRRNAGLVDLFRSYRTCAVYCAPAAAWCVEARQVAERQSVVEAITRTVLGAVAASAERDETATAAVTKDLILEVLQAIRSEVGGEQRDGSYAFCIVTHALHRLLDDVGATNGWSYAEVESMLELILPVGAELVAGVNLSLQQVASLGEFCRTFRAASELAAPPYAFCDQVCGQPPICLYRSGIRALLADEELEADFVEAGNDPQLITAACEGAALRVLSQPKEHQNAGDRRELRRAALCYLIQKTNHDPSQWPSRTRDWLTRSVLGLDHEPAPDQTPPQQR
ncbi:hypothetical protein GCM10009841_21760 [Microlunatus panaciterrae]|uniref:DNA helicase HerA, contains HAS-barrel and ATPase domains n=1 Tax=Microlunatus panaciterrae TaxID=400768 RepID=A0ABS2RP06_9ACTN|nr:ATP-binding protein [Microlunatus panaciterrae]MBM7800730.1 hypothetical protein [Microlunatus panaciterrae]